MSSTPSDVTQLATVDPNATEERFNKLKKKAIKFRVLIIGRANAGKTTILKKICDTTEDPEICNSKGEKIDLSQLEPSAGRGLHDIENEMIFRSNPTYVFHDSRGFESGGADEFNKVKNFISKHSQTRELSQQIHVIWYCIAMGDDRPFQHTEDMFFSKLGTGKVPVVAVFTKSENLETKAISEMEEKEIEYDNMEEVEAYTNQHLKTIHTLLENQIYPPKGHVYLKELNKLGGHCQDLVDCTAAVVTSDTLQALFISAQKNMVVVSVKYATKWAVRGILENSQNERTLEFKEDLMIGILMFFPYKVVYFLL